MSGVGTLEDEALKRKARLAALRAQVKGEANKEEETPDATKRTHEEVDGDGEETEEVIESIRLRNYQPVSEVPVLHACDKVTPKDQAKLDLAEEEKQMIDINAEVMATVDVSKLAPQKVTWDLQRDLTKRMDKLDRRTDRAIVELVAKRLKDATKKSESGTGVSESLDMAVHAGALMEQVGAEGSDDDE
ncbi:hypothetical protein SARC_05832 [Sphaeroforma arctica JP610]|uniref:Cwf18 pre-mRNA splicing factor n=1 Tax=Sphaeroforma arctica JP610 TaxID=667725 RepID=A0A0L0FYE5_9EUKA|nr:hypothetical protein SARC_05832 [Sphaeroforma arctica JP610]KNC81872.1 hypothetical protein SARC_05832 [Sphaeroforma arctica JP610]|eukprot:XP_014155774.1 hypothetical protein SARC_05832 [Sphaeroforma arctica JP610]